MRKGEKRGNGGKSRRESKSLKEGPDDDGGTAERPPKKSLGVVTLSRELQQALRRPSNHSPSCSSVHWPRAACPFGRCSSR